MLTLENAPRDWVIEDMWVGQMSHIERYQGREMIHRPDLWTHVRRVAYLSKLSAQVLNTLPDSSYAVNVDRSYHIGWRHDDPEMITGDFLAPYKASMTEDEKGKLHEREISAGNALATFLYGYPKGSEQYREYVGVQEEYEAKQTIESQLVGVADKWDALCEILHDIRCGNKDYLPLIAFSKGKIAEFSKYPFWKDLAPILGMDMVADASGIEQLPTVSLTDLTSRDKVVESISFDETKLWPKYYQIWSEVNKTIFTRQPEKYVYPGWYLDLWKQWGTVPSGSSTVSGIVFP